jgi:uncharacterized protein YjiK
MTAGVTALLCALVALAVAASPRDRKAKSGSTGYETGGLGEPQRLAEVGAAEPSGVVFHAARGHFFLVGDEGTLVELDGSGRVLHVDRVAGNLEDVAVHTPTGNLMLVSEQDAVLVLFDPSARRELGRWALDEEALLGRKPKDRNQGFEGLAYRSDPRRRGQGVLYLAHQRSPAAIVAIRFDPATSKSPLGADAVASRWVLSGQEDITALTYVSSIDRLLAVTDSKDRLLVVRMDGTVESEVPLAGVQQEGVCLDSKGNLWVADERAGLLRFADALAFLSRIDR